MLATSTGKISLGCSKLANLIESIQQMMFSREKYLREANIKR